jgi:hypothetical protein
VISFLASASSPRIAATSARASSCALRRASAHTIQVEARSAGRGPKAQGSGGGDLFSEWRHGFAWLIHRERSPQGVKEFIS